MSTIKRAFLYVTRKKIKSMLLFFLLLTMATFVLTGLLVGTASQAAQRNLRETLGGGFQLIPDYSKNNPYAKWISDGEGNQSLYTEYPITQEVIDAVISIKGIDSYDAETKTLVSTNLTIFSGNVPVKAEYNRFIYARTVAGTKQNSFFQSGKAELIEGNHITENETNAAVISKDLADKNNLKLGDFISLKNDGEASVRIIGIYKILKPDSPYENIITYEKAENQIFIDFHTLQNLFPESKTGYAEATFTVNDPAQLDRIITEVKALSSIDWQAFEIITNDQDYLNAAAPLQKLQALVSSIILVIVLVSALILSLILTMWGRSRVHETGVFLSLGIGKRNIICQYLTEILIIAVIAFACSYFTSSAITGRFANELMRQNNIFANQDHQKNDVVINRKDGYGDDISVSRKDDTNISDVPHGQNTAPEASVLADGMEADAEQIRVAVDLYSMLSLYFIGFAIIIFSTGISSSAVMRLKPREILSKMS